jgi:RNA polymerase sigma factor (sigma-70 family)
MPDVPLTQPSLLIRLRDASDEQAWAQFVDLYAPLVYGYARRRGLQDADASDVTQVVLRVVMSAIRKLDYDPQRGAFRHWLFTIVRTKLVSYVTRQPIACQGTGDSGMQILLEAQPAPEAETVAWDAEYEQRLFTWAAEQVRAQVRKETWQAFWQTAVEGRRGKEVAASLGLSLGAVRLAKSRIVARLKALIQQAQDSAAESLFLSEPLDKADP